MGYTAAMFMASIIFAPIILVAALAVQLIGWKTGFLPGGFGGFVGYLLVTCAGFALLYLRTTAQMLVWEPAELQRKYIGEVAGGPASLIFFEQSGFQDPVSEWRYRLSPDKSAELRKRCKDQGGVGTGPVCTLFGARDERWFATVELMGNELRMINGLW
jgi:hypothetical protein